MIDVRGSINISRDQRMALVLRVKLGHLFSLQSEFHTQRNTAGFDYKQVLYFSTFLLYSMIITR